MIVKQITPLILTYNEAQNIDRTLQRLTWAKQILIVDSYSTDETLDLIKSYPQVKVIQNYFESFAAQCNFGLTQIESEWVLSLDADYILSQELIEEITNLPDNPHLAAYSVPFKYCVYGKALRGTLYPDRKVLYRKDRAIYENDGHAHRVKIDGEVRSLQQYIYHDDRKSVVRWFSAEIKYADLEVKKLLETPSEQLSFIDRVRLKKVIAPFLVFGYCWLYKGTIVDGLPGLYYTFQRVLAELLLAIKLIEYDFRETIDR
jgi:glycosyltransferase involved in cell wall biosynthesis